MVERKAEQLRITYGGKGGAIRRQTEEGIEQICECLYNLDLSRGCIAQVPVELLLEVYQNQGSYSPERTKETKEAGEKLPRDCCKYCYAQGSNGGNILPRIVSEETRNSFEEHKPQYVRIGKLTEAGHPYYWKTLDQVLDLCEEFGTEIMFPNKMFPFGIEGAIDAKEFARKNNGAVYEIAKSEGLPSGENLANRLKKIGGSLMFSLGYDTLEEGVVSQGFSNQWRIRQALSFYEAGVNTSLTVVCDVTSSIEDNVSRGSMIQEAIDHSNFTGINYRIIPARLYSKECAEFIAGLEWEELKLDPERIEFLLRYHSALENITARIKTEIEIEILKNAKYSQAKKGSKSLIPRVIHEDFLELIEEGVGVCSRIEDDEYCDKCNLTDEKIVFPIEELAPLSREETGQKSRKKEKGNNENGQGKLF